MSPAATPTAQAGKFPALAGRWPADRVKRRPVDQLTPQARNARTHSPTQIDQIVASIREWGWTMPVLVDEAGAIIAGHGRVLAAQQLGLADVPVMVAEGWTDEQKRAYLIADNKLALNAGWDDALLALEFADLKSIGFDLGLTGFAPGEVASVFGRASARAGLTDPDAAPPLPKNPVAKAGDVWTLGRHRLVCGDATDRHIVEACLAGAKPLLMVTDPPYGVDYNPRWRLESGINKAHQKRAEGKVDNDHRADWTEAWRLFPGDVIYCWHGGLHSSAVEQSLSAAGFEVRSQIIWAKASLVIGRGNYHWQHEPCWYAVRKGAKGHWQGDRTQSTLWQIANMHRTQGNVDDGKTDHATQKPVECMRRPMENNSDAGQAVYDPFMGSGTSIIAAEMGGRACVGVELNPAYVDVAVERWQAFSGDKAVRGRSKANG
jgi:DNA modification methylase